MGEDATRYSLDDGNPFDYEYTRTIPHLELLLKGRSHYPHELCSTIFTINPTYYLCFWCICYVRGLKGSLCEIELYIFQQFYL